MREEKANQKDRISFRSDTFSKFFPTDFTIAEMEGYILKLLKRNQEELQKMLEDN
jgi:ParB family chromosome partitioning protein